MAVKFLSEEWAQAMTEALNSSDDFKSAAASQQAKLQQVVTDAPERPEPPKRKAIPEPWPTFGYDAQQMLSEVRFPDGTTTRYEYIAAADTPRLAKSP